MTSSDSEKAAAAIRALAGDYPVNVGLLLGTGLAAVAEHIVSPLRFPYAALPGFPQVTVGGSEAEVMIGALGTAGVAVMKGRATYSETGNPAAMRVPLETLKLLGAEAVVIVNAAGSARPDFAPGSLVAVRDHINLTGINPLIGDPTHRNGNRDMSMAYDPVLRERFAIAAGGTGRKTNEGIYMWFPGPTFETPAEVRAAQMLGADLVGLSLVPEVMIARSLGLRVLAISIVTNLASNIGHDRVVPEQTMRVAGAAVQSLTRVLLKFFEIWVVGSPARR
jgi:purine-nucleoside phosphorylase